MADYSIQDLVNAASNAGFSGASLGIAVAISLAEDTSRDLRAVSVNNDQWKSRDRGPWQINDHWHSEVPDSCAFDLNCSAQAAFRISQNGRSWTPWSTFTSGRYQQFLGQASGVAPDGSNAPGLPSFPDFTNVGTAVQGVFTSLLQGAMVLSGGLIIIVGAVLAAIVIRNRG